MEGRKEGGREEGRLRLIEGGAHSLIDLVHQLAALALDL